MGLLKTKRATLLCSKHTENIMCIPMILRRQVLSYVIVVELQMARDRLHRMEEASHEEEEEVDRRSSTPRISMPNCADECYIGQGVRFSSVQLGISNNLNTITFCDT